MSHEICAGLILNGAGLIQTAWMTKIERADSLTLAEESVYQSARRREERLAWGEMNEWLESGQIAAVPAHPPPLEVHFASKPKALALCDARSATTPRMALDILKDSACEAAAAKEAAE